MKITELEECVSILVRLALRRGVHEIVLPEQDGYLTFTSPEWRDVYESPTPAVGSFSDDETELLQVLRSPDRASAVDCERVAHLLRLLSDQLSAG